MKRMQMNLGLAAAVLALAVAVWVSQKEDKKLDPLTTLKADAVNSIVIDHPGSPTIKLEKKDATWRITAPVNAPTDPFEISSLVGLATLDVKRSLPPTGIDLKELKLDPPNYTITLNDQKLEFGDSEPIEFRRYIKVGQQVDLVSDPPSAALDKDFSDLVAKELLPKDALIQRIELPGLTVVRTEDGQAWTSPDHPDATSEQLQKVADAWQHARSMWNAAEPAHADDSKEEPIRIVLKSGEVKLRIAARKPQLQIDRSDYQVRYTLSEADNDKLFKLPAAETANKDKAPAAAEPKPAPAATKP